MTTPRLTGATIRPCAGDTVDRTRVVAVRSAAVLLEDGRTVSLSSLTFIAGSDAGAVYEAQS